jgi:tryptophan synthase alpha chain
VADAIVIGSRIIQELENTPADKATEAVRLFLTDIRTAIDEIAG